MTTFPARKPAGNFYKITPAEVADLARAAEVAARLTEDPAARARYRTLARFFAKSARYWTTEYPAAVAEAQARNERERLERAARKLARSQPVAIAWAA